MLEVVQKTNRNGMDIVLSEGQKIVVFYATMNVKQGNAL